MPVTKIKSLITAKLLTALAGAAAGVIGSALLVSYPEVYQSLCQAR